MNFKIKASATLLMLALCTGMFAGCSSAHDAGENGNTVDQQQAEVISDQREGGCISKHCYNDKESAAVDFLKREISGSATNAEFVSYKTVREMNSGDMLKLSIGNLTSDDVKFGEIGVITYKDGDCEKTCEVFIIAIDDAFYYYVPAPKTGDVLTKSYFDYVNQSSKYENVIFEYKIEITADSTHPLGTDKYNYNADVKLKVTGNVAHLTNNVVSDGQGLGSDFATEQYYVKIRPKDAYYSEGYIAGFYKIGGEWVEKNIGQINMSDLACPILNAAGFDNAQIDNTYYVKTDEGFAMNEEKVDLWMDSLIMYSIPPDLFVGVSQFGYDGIDKGGDIEYSFTVSNGRVRKIVTKCNFSLLGTALFGDSEEEFGLTYEKNTEMSYKDFGSTGNIEIPHEVLQLIESKGYEMVKKSNTNA